MILILMGVFISLSFTSAQIKDNVCCEQTKTGFYCLNVQSSECKEGARQLPTSCESTSYCKKGICYDSNEGSCVDNTPQLVCNANEGMWSETVPAQCNLGCCILGDQAAFVTLVRCKKLSGFLGLQTYFNKGITSEVQCVMTAIGQEKGACVYDFEFERTCRMTTRYECTQGEGDKKGEFFVGKLCSAEELATNCGPTKETTCLAGRDEVYFKDSCGNAANIYDSSKLVDKNYWTNMKTKLESCNSNVANGNSGSCGNCDYLGGSYCREVSSSTGKASYGNYICADLNCKKTQNGKDYNHGASWCVNDDKGTINKGDNSVGSKFFKHVCINGEEVLEQCAEFRQEECIEDKLVTTKGELSQAACRVNRWQDCTAQTEKIDCENTDRRDCLWKPGADLPALKIVAEAEDYGGGVCLPKNTPGLKFWEGDEAQTYCAQANTQCIVTITKDLFGEEKGQPKNKECLEDAWEQEKAGICMNLGDCGPHINWIGDKGYKSGYNKTTSKYSED